MKTFILPKTEPYEGIDSNMASITRKLLIFLPIPIIGLSTTIFLLNDPVKAWVLLCLIPVILTLIYLLNVGFLRVTIIALATIINILVTWSCVVGNGIHDIGIVVFPLIILFGSLVLRKQELTYIAVLTTLCIMFIVIGEQFEWYVPQPVHEGREADVIILSLILAGGFVSISGITSQLRQALKKAVSEIGKQQALEQDIKQNIEQKSELFKEVHHRVKNHLAFINSVIDLEMMAHPDADKAMHKDLQSQVVAVARVHDQLYHSDHFEVVMTQKYLESIISTFLMNYKLSEVTVKMNIEDFGLPVTQIIHLGLTVHEIIRLFSGHQELVHKFEFILTKSYKHHLTVIAEHDPDLQIDDGEGKRKLQSYLMQQLNGSMDMVTGKKKVLFEMEF